MTPNLSNIINAYFINMKLLAPCVTKHLSVSMWICIASKADVAAPTEPVTQDFILLSSVCEAL